MDSSIHALLIAQHIKARLDQADAARTVSAVKRERVREPKLRLRRRLRLARRATPA
jgi:hypothetical protein